MFIGLISSRPFPFYGAISNWEVWLYQNISKLYNALPLSTLTPVFKILIHLTFTHYGICHPMPSSYVLSKKSFKNWIASYLNIKIFNLLMVV